MWKTFDRSDDSAANVGRAMTGVWTAGSRDWTCRAAGGSDGISLGDPDGSLHVAIQGINDHILPIATDQHIRGSAWKIDFPQADGQFGLRLSIRVIESSEEQVVLEPTISIQTSLLDSHPVVELSVIGDVDATEASRKKSEAADRSTVDLSAGAGQIAVLLGEHDAPFTADHSTDHHLKLHLFGDFLEKGVLRKARPWIILNRSAGSLTDEKLEHYQSLMRQTPPPLTP